MAFPGAKSGFTLEDLVQMGPDAVTRQKLLAEAMLRESGGQRDIRHPLQGMAQMAEALIGNLKGARAAKAELAGKQGASDLFSAGLGLGEFPSAPGAGGGSGSVPPGEYTGPSDIKDGIAQTAQALGIDPVDLATAISYETGGTFDPKQPGPTTKWGQHRGLIQFGEPQAKEFGVDWDNPVASQLGPDGAVAKYLRKTGVKPGMKLLDIYAAINAGGVGKYNASDAHAGGAPGTVRDKVERQMGRHREKALAMFGGGAQAPVQVASLDPSIGMGDQAAIGQALTEQGIDPNGPQAQAFAGLRVGGPQPEVAPPAPSQTLAEGLPANSPIIQALPQPGFPPAPTAAQPQMAQALIGGDPASTLGAPAIDRANGPDMGTIANMMGNEWMNPGQQKMIETLLGQQLKRQDPAYQQDLEKGRLEIERLKNPQMTPAEKANYDLNVQKYGAERADEMFRQKDTQADNQRADKQLSLAEREAATTGNIKDYDAYAADETRAGRTPLGRLEYEQSLRKSGATNVTTNVGEGDKFYENLDKKNAEIFSALSDTGIQARSKLALVDRLGGLLDSTQTGGLAALKQTAGEWGIDTEGLSDIQAAQAVINKLVPEQRQPGSGPMSDRDLELFKASLPRVINQPGGNKIIVDTLRSIAQYQIQMGEIADAVSDRAMTPAEARKAIRELPNPLADFGKATPTTKPITEYTDDELEELAK